MESSQGRMLLERRLEEFLGFDTGVGDVLDHLLSIVTETGERDLLSYLSQLLGEDGEVIQQFASDVGRLQKGLPIVQSVAESGDIGSNSNAADVSNMRQDASEAKPKPSKDVHTSQNKVERIKKPDGIHKEPPQQETKKEQPAPNMMHAATNLTVLKPSVTKTTAAAKIEASGLTKQPDSPNPSPPPITKRYEPPPRGQAKRNCGCFGTLHKPLTNCLFCGRIACEEEGYDFCPFCGFLVEDVKVPDGEINGKQSTAWQHKERLLRYDREFAKRTVIYDDQADYYGNRTSTWLSEEEQTAAENKDEEQRRDLHQRKNMQLKIAP